MGNGTTGRDNAAAPLGWGWKQGKNFRNCQGNSLRNRHCETRNPRLSRFSIERHR